MSSGTGNVIFTRIRSGASMREERSEEYVEAAIAEGFEVIGFSDHSPYLFEHGYVSGIRMDMCELEGYVRTVEELKREYRKDIEIYVALEMEYFPPLFDRTMEEIRQYPLGLYAAGTAFLL